MHMRIRSISVLFAALSLCSALAVFAIAGCGQQKPGDPTTLPSYDPKVKPAPASQAYPPPFDLKREQQGIPPGKGPDFSKIVSH